MTDFIENPSNCAIKASMIEKGTGEDAKKRTQHPLTVPITKQNYFPFSMNFVQYFSHNLMFGFYFMYHGVQGRVKKSHENIHDLN